MRASHHSATGLTIYGSSSLRHRIFQSGVRPPLLYVVEPVTEPTKLFEPLYFFRESGTLTIERFIFYSSGITVFYRGP
jgi:hypothetical protein